MMLPLTSSSSPETGEGRLALSRGAWQDARDAFESILRLREEPEALEGLGLAAWWLDDAHVVFDARERAYRLYLTADRPLDAARVAVWLAWDSWAFRGEHAVANGWLQRARRLLEGFPPCAEQAWLEIREGSMSLFEEGDPERAHAMAGRGIELARHARSIDFEMLGRAVQGLALVGSGAVAEGMGMLDEVNAAVVAGELTDLVAIGLACCYLIAACDRVRDYDRALQWCTRLKAFCAKWGLRPLFAVCRTQYASLCMWRGTWLEAEEELRAASQELADSRPGMISEATVRLAELRRRQGRLVEATALFDQAGPNGLALLGRAELAMDRGDLRAAADQAARYLRQVPAHNRTDRAAALDLLVRALCGLGDPAGAGAAMTELTTIATLVNTQPLRALASAARACMAVADKDSDTARQHLEDAVDLYLRSGAPFEVARTRVDLAEVLASLGRAEDAVEELQRAIAALSELHAEGELARAKALMESTRQDPDTTQSAAKQPAHDGPLTPREVEVLRLVAEGLNNQAIAERLFVSDHTVHRHLANILNKLSVSTRAAAVAQAARRGLLV
jgi:DNA-binding NarL/FixJ family response regulator